MILTITARCVDYQLVGTFEDTTVDCELEVSMFGFSLSGWEHAGPPAWQRRLWHGFTGPISTGQRFALIGNVLTPRVMFERLMAVEVL